MFKNLKISKKALELSVLFGFLCSVFWSFADFNVSCEQLRQNVLRLHIVANSDSAPDQALKLKIRDRILLESGAFFDNTENLAAATEKVKANLKDFEKTAKAVIKECGFDYSVEVKIGKAYFENREYDTFTLPAGEYESLIINIGDALGKNWWCVIFPQVCLPAAGNGNLSDSVGKKGVAVAENPQDFVVKFKAVEIYENLKHRLSCWFS